MRLLGKDPLRLPRDPDAASYWIDRTPPGACTRIHEEPVLSPMLSFLREFWSFLRVRKKYWLLPIFIMMTIFGGLIMLTQGSAVAPFIYTLF
jgi:hypothetical protein